MSLHRRDLARAHRPARPLRPARPAAAAAGALLAGALVTGCGTPGTAERVDVYAASSLTGVFTELAAEFEAEHPDVDVALNFAGSADLAVQIAEGAPADVFVAADHETMQRVLDSGRATGRPAILATNRLTIAVAEGNPLGVRSLADLDREDVITVVCAEQVPCGRAARAVVEQAVTGLRPASEENSVTDVVGKLRSGQADAGLVYVTDVAAHEDSLDGVALPGADGAANPYTLVGVEGGSRERSERFTAFVTGPTGRERLSEYGFDP